MIQKLISHTDFYTTVEIPKNKSSLTNLWKINHSTSLGNEFECMKQMLKEWKSLLEHILMEALKKNVFLVSTRANQCLESFQLIKFE